MNFTGVFKELKIKKSRFVEGRVGKYKWKTSDILSFDKVGLLAPCGWAKWHHVPPLGS